MAIANSHTIGFGGGCHWCTEAVFAALKGVSDVEQGYIASVPPDEALSEAVIVHFDPATISLEVLVEVHLHTHSSTSNHTMRGKYRSAIYATSDAQRGEAEEMLSHLQAGFDEKLVTRVLPFVVFEPSPEQFRDYAVRNQGKPFCRAYIDPKLAVLRRDFSAFAASV
ncbi:peptide-methionine (S)-S-oxide reductase [Cucumibacter marinus]|uniref:peptide-methionine (S)-S-oxide reductase n=1 Tax=Cucumibacter marinus TaxID=1121252 RepID=UPI0003F53B37|nr:peptide-methionine (S)-S-oxide reductase [Cucumibacter marinus]